MTQATNKTFGERVCLWCETKFTANKSNQIYCQSDCTKKATNQKIIERYHANKNKNRGERKCEDCQTKLSKYNAQEICGSCQIKRKDQARKETLKRLGFGYEVE